MSSGMEKLPRSFRERNRTTRDFRSQYDNLPSEVQRLVRKVCLRFNENPNHPAFRAHQLEDRRGASHVPETISISITMQYRALYVHDNGVNVWYWIGSHAAYKTFTASSH